MGSVGYGNHDTSPPGATQAESPEQEPAASTIGQGSADRPGMDLGGAKDRSGASGQMAGRHSTPDPTGAGPHSGMKDSNSPTLSDDNRRQVSTPGDGAGVSPGQAGSDVDAGTG